MIIARMLRPIRFLSLLLAILMIGGCGSVLTERVPKSYSHVSTVSAAGDFGEAFGVAISDDAVYVSDGQNGAIRRFAPDADPTTFASNLKAPSAIAFHPDGDLIVADTGSHTIRKVSATGEVALLAGIDNTPGSIDGPALAATFNGPVGLAVTRDGSIYISDTYNDRIRVIRDGIVSTIAGGGRGFADGIGSSAMFDTPLGIAVWGQDLLIADSGNVRIRILDPNGVVRTLAGSGHHDLVDGTLSSSSFVMPTAITVDDYGRIFIADGNSVRVIGQRLFPSVDTLVGDKRGFADGSANAARFNRLSGLAVHRDGGLYVADSDNRALRLVSDGAVDGKALPVQEDQLPLADRWPFDPPQNPREVAGTLGEIRGEIGPEEKQVWFHNGLDIAGAYGETTKFLRDETVLSPHAAENFGTSRELLRMPLIGYIHLRLGRDKDNRVFDDSRFQFETDVSGKLTGLRVPRGAKFSAGETIGTLNSMNHVHLIAGRTGKEINALTALKLPGIGDSIAPVIESVKIFDTAWNEIEATSNAFRLAEKNRIVVRAYDRMDGNSERRRLGVYRLGYKLISNGTPIGEVDWTIRFDRMPSNDAVRVAYAYGSQSGYSPRTIFDYIVTNRVDGDSFGESFLDASGLAPGNYSLRVFAADFFGNVTSKDVEVLR